MKFKFWNPFKNERGGFDVAMAAIIGLAGAGAVEGINALTSSPKQPSQPTVPNQQTADQAGAATVANQRAILLASGGETDYTGGMGVLAGSDVSKSTLVGG